jgi:hypothetical protein
MNSVGKLSADLDSIITGEVGGAHLDSAARLSSGVHHMQPKLNDTSLNMGAIIPQGQETGENTTVIGSGAATP